MKLTKRLLAIVLAAAMLVGMFVISSSAIQLDEDVPTLTWDDCAIDKDNNPYTVKLAYKIYKVDTASGEYTLLEDTNTSNDTLDVKVDAGDVLRVECWVQTNFHASSIQLTPAYNNAWLLPTTMDYTVVTSTASYPLKCANAAGKIAMDQAFPECMDFCDEFGTGDGTFENPVFAGEALSQAKGQINHNSWGGLRGVLPKDWQGKSQTEAGWLNTSAKDQWGNNIVDENGKFIYNVYQFGSSANSTSTDTWPGYTIVLNVYQPVAAFNLTVADNAEGTAKLFFPESSYYNTANAYTSVTAVDYDALLDSPNNNGNWDESMPQIATSGLKTYANKVTYPDGTQTDKNWIVTNATITVGGAEGGEDDTTTEAPTEPPVEYADLAALKAAIANAATADTANCTSASVAEFNAALAAANALNVEGTLATEQDAIDAAAARLTAAIAGLKKLGTCNYAALDAAINTVVDTTNCTAASVKAYNDALAAAKAIARGMIADEAGANQAKIDAATTALNAAIAGLTKLGECDYTALDAAIAAALAADTANCTSASIAALNNALAAAEAVARGMIADEAGANQAKIDAAATALNAAVAGLTKLGKVNYAALDAAIAAFEALNAADYTPNSWAASNVDALAAAAKAVEKDMFADEAGANQAKADNAAAALNAAIAKLVKVADKAALAAAIAAAPTNAAGYTPDSWAPFAAALADANAVNADANATQDAVNAAVAALAAAQGNLVEKADKSALADAIAGAESLDEADYTPESWAEADLATAIADAKAVLADDNATAAAVADAIQLLRDAALNLVEKADTDALEDAIATLPEIKEEDATPETWAAYEAALAAAQLVLDNPNATQDDVDAAEAALLAAIAGVQEKETVYCDYAALDAAIAAYEAKLADKDLYANWAEYEAAYNAAKAIARGTEYSEDAQAAIDAAAAALNAVVLTYKAADYTAVDAAKATIPADLTIYTDATVKAVNDAVAAVVEGLDITKQADVDAMAKAIADAVAALEYKAADYTAVDAAKAAAAAIDASKYTSASYKAVTDAVAAVVDGLDITKQAEVDAMAKAINDAIAALAPLAAADYTALDEALSLVPAEEEDAYTAKSWKAYADAKKAAEAIARDLLADEAGVNQKAIDDAAAALVAAFEGLKVNVANVTDVEYDNTGVCTKATLTYEFKVNGAASKIQVIGPDGGTMTFDRRSSRVTITSYNEAGEVVDYADEDPAYEVWSIDLALDATEYQVRAKYDYTWDTEKYAFTVEYDEYDTTAESFTATVGNFVDATEVTAAKGEVITFKAVTDANALKVQFVFADGGTSTYTKSKAVDNGDGTLTWTITRVFSKSQDINLKVKAPTGWATEYSGNVVVTIG